MPNCLNFLMVVAFSKLRILELNLNLGPNGINDALRNSSRVAESTESAKYRNLSSLEEVKTHPQWDFIFPMDIGLGAVHIKQDRSECRAGCRIYQL